MDESPSLASLGWSDFFAGQVRDGDPLFLPRRVSGVRRARLEMLSPGGLLTLPFGGGMQAGDFAIGDWVMSDGLRLGLTLARRTVLARRGAGSGPERQLIAANVDTLFIVTSCNADFNLARLERYLALAAEAGARPVILLTKADAGPGAEEFRAQALRLQRGVEVLALDGRDAEAAARLAPWCGPGQTVALVGSSGVGKTTLANTLTGEAAATGPIRESDARGRHTTTGRSLHPLAGGGWLIDTPGMRSLGMADAAAGIDAVFAEVAELIGQCRFRDCTHQTEPGCAIRLAVAEGRLDAGRLARWDKLKREDRQQGETLTTAARERGRRPGRRTGGRPATRAGRDSGED